MGDEKQYRVFFSRDELLRIIACLNAVADSYPGKGKHPESERIKELSKRIEEVKDSR